MGLRRSLGLSLSGGLLGGAISFGILLVAAMIYFDLLYHFQTLVSGILAIGASFIVLWGVRIQIRHDRRAEEDRIKHDAFAFANALLNETNKFQSKMTSIYSKSDRSIKHGLHRRALKGLSEDIRDVKIPALFESPWREMGLLSPDITSLVRTIVMSVDLAKSWGSPYPWLLEEPLIPGILSPKIEFRTEDKDERLHLIEMYLQEQIEFYEAFIELPLRRLMICLEDEVEEYGRELGIDEKTRRLRAQAKARREARRQSEETRDRPASS
jgi:hypothetical protein